MKKLTGLTSPQEFVNCRAKPKSSMKHFLHVLGKRPIAKFDWKKNKDEKYVFL